MSEKQGKHVILNLKKTNYANMRESWKKNNGPLWHPDINLYGGAVYSRKCCQNVTKVRMGDHFCLKWNNHQENLTGIMTKLLDEQKFVDVSLVCEMKTFKAHQTVLSACSPYFEQVLEENPHPHPIIILRDVKESEMSALLQYMYRGEVSVRDDELSAFLHTARALKVRGLSENKKETAPQSREEVLQSSTLTQIETATPPKRPRTSTTRVNEQEVVEKHHSESQSLTVAPNVCKTSPKPSSNTPLFPVMNYSENSSEMHYSESSTPTQTIKQEVENISVPSEESSAIPHLANLEQRTDQCHKLGEWSFDYGHPMENRNYQTQKGLSTGCSLLQTTGALNSSLTDPGGTDVFDGSKQWQIKYAFEKVEGSGFKCKICGQIKKHVRNHYLKHFPEHHECHLCRRTYTRKDNLNSHLKRDHFQRVKTPPDPYHRLKRLTRKLEDCQGLKCFTPDLYSQMKYTSAIRAPSIQAQSSPVPGPMDLSLRPSSVPIQPQCTPIYDILPSLYNYFRT